MDMYVKRHHEWQIFIAIMFKFCSQNSLRLREMYTLFVLV